MTSRLKRKLNDLGVDASSSKATENFCLIGTPLPPLEKSRDTGEFVPVWKQDVRDEKGRRRLHGAFTGGFSAGYFNSVGSREGWTPSEFKSSRSDRAKKQVAKAEDFMDEEDLAEIRDSQKLVDTTEEMDVNFWERGKTASVGDEKDSVTSVLEATLLPAPRDSVGAQILKKMGWRLGHGIGPKVTYEERKRQDARSHAPAGSGGALPDTEDHEEAKRHLYPPRDTKVLAYKRKEDKHGLGYEPGMGLSDMLASGGSTNKQMEHNQGPDISAGFGLGALNDADEDDIDVYDRGYSRTNRTLAYDDEEDEEHAMRSSHSKDVRTSSKISRAPFTTVGKTTLNSGLPCVAGFVVAENPVSEENLFPPPVVPKGWKPDPRRVWQDKENLKSDPVAQDVTKPPKDSKGWHRGGMSANERGNLLGEMPLPVPPRSVFDYLAPKDRERLDSLASGRIGVAKSEDSEPGPPIPEQGSTVPRLDPQVAKMALQGFQPFTADPTKQARYTAYLKAQSVGEDSVPFSRMSGQATDAFARELEDYARSAQIFKPVSGAMAGRFTRAAAIEVGAKAAEGLHHPAEEGSYLSTPAATKEIERQKEESPKENAARLGMFGPLTREAKPWVPAKLLCKRFGVKEPQIELQTEEAATPASSSAGNWQSAGLLAITDGAEAGLTGSTRIGESGSVSKNGHSDDSSTKGGRDVANIGLGDEDDTQGRDILTYERPGMDVFKAIFANDEEDEGDGDDQAEDDDEGQPQADESTRSDAGANGSASSQPKAPSLPPAPVDYNNAAGKIDIADFKPTFVPRSDRAKEKEKEKQGKGNDKDKDREKKKKKNKATLVSFEIDEEGDGRVREKETKKKRKKKNGKKDDEDDEGMWVEKPPPETARNSPPPVLIPGSIRSGNVVEDDGKEAGPSRGRKRAIDFM